MSISGQVTIQPKININAALDTRSQLIMIHHENIGLILIIEMY